MPSIHRKVIVLLAEFIFMLSGKVFIVTGGGRGLGKATCLELGERGANIVVNDLGSTLSGEGKDQNPAQKTVNKIRESGGNAISHCGDVTSLEYTNTLIEDTISEYGKIDGIANFAGIINDSPLHTMSGEEWDKVIRVHLRGHFSLLRNISNHWLSIAEEEGLDNQRSFLSLASRSSHSDEGRANYSTAKAGILGLTRTAAREFYEYNIRVNALVPTAYTRMVEYTFEREETLFSKEEMPPEIPAGMSAFLLSDHAEDITGCTIRIGGELMGIISDPELDVIAYRDGGWTAESIRERFVEAFGPRDDLTKLDKAFDR